MHDVIDAKPAGAFCALWATCALALFHFQCAHGQIVQYVATGDEYGAADSFEAQGSATFSTSAQAHRQFARQNAQADAGSPNTYRIPRFTTTLPALEPKYSEAQLQALERDLNEPYLNPVPQFEPSRRGPIKRALLFWKPEKLNEIPPPQPPANVIWGEDPRQRDRDWTTIINSLPPEPSTPTIEIFLSRQVGRYRGMIFPALGGNRFPTPKGSFRVNFKSKDHYSRKYDAPMPYSLFFTEQCAIHEGSLYLYSHGCIHVNMPTAKMLFAESVAGQTPVVVRP